MWAAVVPRVTPARMPRAYWSQCGAPSPANAGTRYTPCGSVTCEASASTSDDDLMIPRPSRSHCTTAPAMKMLPSSAYSVRFPIRHATVVSRLFLDAIGFVPVFMSMKQPVPYVFFTMPGWVRARDVAENPFQLGAGEIRVYHQPRLALDQRREPAGLQPVAGGGRAAILPHDGVMHRRTRVPVPDDRCFSLIGYPYAGDVERGQ